MAKAKKTEQAAVTLEQIAAGGADGVIVNAEAIAQFVADGLVEVNPAGADEAGNIQARVTQKYLDAQPKNMQTEGLQETQQTTKEKPMFQIEDNVEMPARTRAVGAGRQSQYPFDQLEVGQSFFVPHPNRTDKDGKPITALTSMASNVSGANARYSEVIEGETRKNRKGNIVPATRQLRKFEVRAVEGGARVWRTQ